MPLLKLLNQKTFKMITKNFNGQESFQNNSEFWRFVNQQFQQLKESIIEKSKEFSFDNSYYPQLERNGSMTEAQAVQIVTEFKNLENVNRYLGKTYAEKLFKMTIQGQWLYSTNGCGGFIKAGELEGKYPNGSVLEGFMKNHKFNVVSFVQELV